MFKDYPIQKFGSKLMVSSKAINTIPNHYLSYSQNARIYDGGIGPRKGKQILTNSTLGINRGGFIMGGKLYQITNSKIYEVDKTTGVQTEKATLGYDAMTDVLVYGSFTIIASNGQAVKVFDGTTVTTPATVPASNNGILEYCRGYSFLASGNVLYISRPITVANPTYAYDWTGSGSQNITYEEEIKGLKATQNGLYVFLKSKVEFLGANALQNVAGSSTFISTPIGDGSEPINNLCITASGDKIFWLSKNLQIQTINYQQGITIAQIGELSARPVVSIKELLNTLDTEQPNSFAFYNENDKTIQMHLRTIGSPINDISVIYDLVNDTWNVDTGKFYNYIVKDGANYYGFSDINSAIYLDDTSNSDNGVAIDFKIRTQNIIIGPNQTLFGGFYIKGAVSNLTDLTISANIDGINVFNGTILGSQYTLPYLGEIAGDEIGGGEIAGPLTYIKELNPFDKRANQGRIFQMGNRIQYEITSQSQIQDFIIDMLGTTAEPSIFTDTQNIF